MEDDRSERFRRLAEKRVARTVKDLRLIGNLANRSNYSYSRDEAEKILRTLEKEVKSTRARFESAFSEKRIVFSLRD